MGSKAWSSILHEDQRAVSRLSCSLSPLLLGLPTLLSILRHCRLKKHSGRLQTGLEIKLKEGLTAVLVTMLTPGLLIR